MNHGAEELFQGIEPLLGRDFSELARVLWPEPRATDVVRAFQRTLATGDAYVAERAGALRGSGRMAAYDWQIQRLTLPDGTAGVVCYAYDLTPIREAERVLTQAATRDAFLAGLTDAVRALPSAHEVIASAAARLGQALHASQVAYADVDADTGVVRVDADWTDGAMVSPPGRHRVADLVHGLIDELRAGRALAIADVRVDERTQRPEIQAAFARASVAACLDVPLVKAGRLVGVLAVSQADPRQWLPTEIALAQEVAERTWAAVEQTRAEARLRDSEARLKLALDAAGMGTFVWHVDEGRGEPDARALELFGITEVSPSPQQAFESLVHPADRARCAAAVTRALDPVGAGTLHEDIRVLVPGGDVRWLAITARTTFAGQPRRAVRIAGVVDDIGDRKRIEASLREREEALTGADRRKDEFLAMLAHELRNPLAPIRAGLELIRLNGDSRIAVERTRAIMERQVGHMVRLIDDLLDVSRISSGKIHLQRRPTPVDVLVNTAVEANREAITAARLTLDLTLPDAPIWLDTDPTRGVQVISNVLHNAVKFTDAGGRIAIGARVEDGGSMLALTITDSGMGISADMLPRVFDLFTQDRAAGSRSHTGLGIGLALARRLIEMHGGTIEARSDGAGRGSTFIIRLPSRSRARRRLPPNRPTRRRRAPAIASSSSTTTSMPPTRWRC
jgi:signal transduction histidine kinase